MDTTHPTTKAHDEQFNLLVLPRELRDMIYEQSLNFNSIQRVIDKCNAAFPHASHQTLHDARPHVSRSAPSILLTNRQVHNEAIRMLHRSDLYITTPLLGADVFFGWSGPTGGTGISFRDLLPDDILLRIRSIGFRFQIWDVAYFRTDKDVKWYGQVGELPAGNWRDDEEQAVLLHAKAWAKLWMHVLDVLLEAMESRKTVMVGKRLTMEMERRGLGSLGETQPYSMLARFEIPVKIEELRRLKTAIWVSWQPHRYGPLLRCLETYRKDQVDM